MSNLAEKRNGLEQLLQQAELPIRMIDSFFADGYIDVVECSRSKREWTFTICKQQLIPSDVYGDFCRMVRERFRSVADIRFVIRYSELVSDEALVLEYWEELVDTIMQNTPSINGWLSKAEVHVEDRTIVISLLDETAVEHAKKKGIDEFVRRFYNDFFSRSYRIVLSASESSAEQYEKFAKQIIEEERSVVSDLLAEQSMPESAGSSDDVRLSVGFEIKEQPIPINHIAGEEKRTTIHGFVFGVSVRELRNGSTLYQFYMSDYSDSISLKVFAKNKDDVRAMNQLKDGLWVKARGKIEYDKFLQTPELVMIPNDLHEIAAPPERADDAERKRIEFHLHTTMSAMDGIASATDYIKKAASWGHKAIAITDHGVVQAFPEANAAAKKFGMKVIYGVEANVVNDAVPVVLNAAPLRADEATYVVFDVETTGLSVVNNKLIEIAGVKMKEGKVIERFASFVNPHEKIPYNITQLTNITDEMVIDAPDVSDVVPRFVQFVGDAVLVAHNARFDMGFMQEACKRLSLPLFANPVLDTLELARMLYPTMKNHRLNTLADKFKVGLENHHRAIDDAEALGNVLFLMLKDAIERGITHLDRMNDNVGKNLSNVRPFHSCIYAKNAEGKKRLFELISSSHTEYYNKSPCIPKSKLLESREGLIISSGCEKGEFFETVLNKSEEEAEVVAQFYDVLEIIPIDFLMYLVDRGVVGSRMELEEAVRRVCRIGKKLGKPVIATGNAHYLEPRDKIFRDITINGITGFSPLKEMKKPDAHLRTTTEMLETFAFLGTETAFEVVVDNTNRLADEFVPFEMFPKVGGPTNNGLFSPIIEGADEEIRTKCYETALSMYGDPLPEIITSRLEKELEPIIKYGFSANYLISERLVKKSNEDGYLVGSRGSVGSSVVAMMLGISEVNPLPAHYLCPHCKHSEWFLDGSVPSGFDLPYKPCEKCGQTARGDGQDIPFETFLGFKGDKVPDIDLNFSGEYQPRAHAYTKELFGEKSVFRAGTIGTVAEKTAFGFVKKYEEEKGLRWRQAELQRLALGVTGVKRSTGQHPGGIVVVPDYIDVEHITPIQFPADDTKSEWKTTHFDYHAFDENLLKLDILGHDDPTMMRMLQDLTGVDPTSISMNDPQVMSLFHSTKALGVTSEQIRSPVATFGIPEMGTKFVRQMLEETQPDTFADLLQISGLSHGKGVWLGNAQDLIKNGTCTIKTVIGCRDDIMLYLIYSGMDAALAFKITESVRRGRGLTEEWIADMKKVNVPNWYIDSCQKIEYMFPRAHAAAYVTSAVRTAYFKLYHPIEFYAAYYSIRGEEFDVELFCSGYEAILNKLLEIEAKAFQALPKEKNMVSYLEMGLEMTARGLSFKGIDLYRSEAARFVIDGDALIPPFASIPGIGHNAARNIVAARSESPFLSVEDFQIRTKLSKTVVEVLSGLGCFRGMPESNQLSLF